MRALLAIYIAYALATEALMASIGLGMSAFAIRGQDALVICGHAKGSTVHAKSKSGGPRNRAPQPRCPYCVAAAQAAAQPTTPRDPPALPAYSGYWVSGTFSGCYSDEVLPLPHRRNVGYPRAPPAFSA